MVIGRPRGNNSWTSQSSGYDGPPGAQLAMPNMSTFRHGKQELFTTQELGCDQEKIVMHPCENLELHGFTPSQKKGIRLDLTRTREITPES